MFSFIYKKLIINFPKVVLVFISFFIISSLYLSKNFNLDASSDALLLEGDKDLKYLRDVNNRYGGKDFFVKGINKEGNERYFAHSFVESVTDYWKHI